MSNDTYKPARCRTLHELPETRPHTVSVDETRKGGQQGNRVNNAHCCPCFKCEKRQEKHGTDRTCEKYRHYLEHGDRTPKGKHGASTIEELKAKQAELRAEYKKLADVRTNSPHEWNAEASRLAKKCWAKLNYTNGRIKEMEGKNE
jgi:hypothetical protein